MNKFRWFVLVGFLPLLMACGGGGSDCRLLGNALCNSSDPAVNQAPVANPGVAQSVLLSQGAVQLDGSASTDINGDQITYSWALRFKPSRSEAVLSGPSLVKPTFTPDVLGVYEFSLVVSDGKLNSAVSFVKVTVSEVNAPPVANAGPDQSVLLGSLVTLDGRDSSDANRDDVLTFTWSLVRPDGSSQVLTGVRPAFTAVQTGTYTASLTVRDAVSSSEPDAVRVVVAAENLVPVAAVTPLPKFNMGEVVQLSGLGSTDGNRDFLTYKWALLSKPLVINGAARDSSAVLSSTTAHSPTFTADVAGVYVVSLVVNDGKVNSDPVTLAITVVDPNPSTGLSGLSGN